MKRAVLHCLTAILLVAASMAIWHWRFVVDPGALPETRLDKPLVGWFSAAHEQHEVVMRDGQAVLLLRKGSPKDKQAGVRIWYGPLEQVKYIHVRCESRWNDVVPGPHTWLIARFAANMKNHQGAVSHPPGSHIFGGIGDSDWHAYEVVLKLTDDMADIGFAIAMLGNSGTLEVRNLSMVAVRQRPWVPFATTFVVLGGIAFCISLIRSSTDRPSFTRASIAALVLVASFWILVFPQTKGFLYPIPRSFAVGDLEPPAPQPAVLPSVPEKPKAPTSPSLKPPLEKPATPQLLPKPPPIKPEPAAPASTPKPQERDSSTLHRTLREVDKRFGPTHLVLFTGLTLGILLITGRGSQWRLPLALAVLSEVVPELTDHLGGWDDWADLILNLTGVGIATLLWFRLPFLKRFHVGRAD